MKRNIRIIALMFVIGTFLVSCTTPAYIGMIGTRNIDYSATYSKGDLTDASEEMMFILVIPAKIGILHPIEIIDKALEKGDYEFLTDVTFEVTQIPAFVINYAAFKVRGTGWRKAGSGWGSNLNNKMFMVVPNNGDYELTEITPGIMDKN